MIDERWRISFRADAAALPMADRHYNRQKPGTPQFVPPGRCIVLLSESRKSLWVTSWPFAKYTKHAWAGAWVNTLFRKENSDKASDLILSAIAATKMFWPVPDLGLVTFVNPDEVPGVMVRGERIYGFCYMKAGFHHVGFTGRGLWVWQLLPHEMPPAEAALGTQTTLFGTGL